jgi:LPXTG-motif cell wall-anchored protein
MKRWYLAFLVIIPLLVFLVVTASNGTDAAFNKSKELAALRRVGHQLLLTIGDSTSLVLPVREISENEFQITFEKKFPLQPEILADVFRKLYPPSGDYAVEVRKVAKTAVLYSFVLSSDSAHTIVPCAGRTFQEAWYTITVKLPHTNQSKGYYIAGMLVLLAGGGIWLYKRKVRPSHLPVTTTADTAIVLGRFRFIVEQHRLELNGNIIELTGKEAQLLKIFALSPNMVIERNRLLKEVWEDEGVIVTRSLDMFISKLRKKLEGDPGIKLVNVHGKGYRLDVA